MSKKIKITGVSINVNVSFIDEDSPEQTRSFNDNSYFNILSPEELNRQVTEKKYLADMVASVVAKARETYDSENKTAKEFLAKL